MTRTENSPRIARLRVSPDAPIRDAMRVVDEVGIGLALVCDAQGILLGTVTDGDIRRAILAGSSLDAACRSIANLSPVTAPDGVTSEEALARMNHARSYPLSHLPLLDEAGRVTDLVLRRDLTSDQALTAVVMAGGLGQRLRPLTEAIPKPMLPVGDRPLLEHTIEQLRRAGINRVNVTTHYLPEKIRDHFEDGKRFGVSIEYVEENEPLGTAGALSLLERPDGPMLVMNGDILTRVNFGAMHDFHREHAAELTIGVREYKFEVPYGVVEADGAAVQSLQEKPALRFLVNAGIYILEPAVWDLVPTGRRYHMTELIEALLAQGRSVVSFPIVEYWLDIGQVADYRRGQEDMKNGRVDKLP